MTRIPFLAEDTLNIFRVVGHRPDLLEAYRALGQKLLFEGQVPTRSKELVVCAVAAATGSDYLWSHHSELARTQGVSDAELDGARTGSGLDGVDAACVRAAQQVARNAVSDEDVDGLRDVGFETGQILEVMMLAAYYAMTAQFLEALDVPLEEGRTGLPRT